VFLAIENERDSKKVLSNSVKCTSEYVCKDVYRFSVCLPGYSKERILLRIGLARIIVSKSEEWTGVKKGAFFNFERDFVFGLYFLSCSFV